MNENRNVAYPVSMGTAAQLYTFALLNLALRVSNGEYRDAGWLRQCRHFLNLAQRPAMAQPLRQVSSEFPGLLLDLSTYQMCASVSMENTTTIPISFQKTRYETLILAPLIFATPSECWTEMILIWVIAGRMKSKGGLHWALPQDQLETSLVLPARGSTTKAEVAIQH
ncbi:hypothetical protein ACO22_00460 [Paracoccidioides brasiliensis]|uniref:Uncharacterized protein n=1 Tax=Paracoccidioides brasiliensis TaxID=121759 RepID=A0A1D2JPF3_PARBR|nr:hypothetical protein ACO22_00460 [Paracoccidioides brasiliensis]